MIAKVALLVLLAAAAVLAAPEVRHKNVQIDAESEKKYGLSEFQERSIEDTWAKLKLKFYKALEVIKATWQKIKERGEKIYNANLRHIREKGLALLQLTKEAHKQVVAEGKAAQPDIDEIRVNLKDLMAELKKTGDEAYNNVQELVQEVVKTATDKLHTNRRGVMNENIDAEVLVERM